MFFNSMLHHHRSFLDRTYLFPPRRVYLDLGFALEHSPVPDRSPSLTPEPRLSFIVDQTRQPHLRGIVAIHTCYCAASSTRPRADRTSLSSQPFSRAAHLFANARLHKRATSAPDFAPASTPLLLPHTSTPTYPGLLPPPHQTMAMSATSSPVPREVASVSQAALGRPEEANMATPGHVEPERATGQGPRTVPSSPLNSAGGGLTSIPRSFTLIDDDIDFSAGAPEAPRCMFVANCDTGSQLRKAISHLFGRNKSCTLKIPKDVWVYYCRKHYQRIRYRNARTYPSNQMELVKVQIVRLQRWSEANKAKGSGPCIKQWTLSLRKREQNRLDSGKGAGDEGDEDTMTSQGGSAVPEWIIQLLGDGYTTEKMLDIAERLHQEIERGSLSTVPEIEFLPDIVDGENGTSSKPVRARRQESGSKTPKRKALDLPGPFRQDPISGDVFSDEHEEGEEVGDLLIHSGKRARIGKTSSRLPYYGTQDSSDPHHSQSAHGYMMPAYGDGYGRAMFPPRAPHVVPKMSPMGYGQARTHGDFHQFMQSPFEHHGHAMGDVFHRGTAAAYGSEGVRYAPNHVGGGPQTALPSISSRVPSSAGLQQSALVGRAHGAGLNSHVSARPSHHRSSSAYSLASRNTPTPTRPSSSGTGDQASFIRREMPEAMYSISSRSPQSLAAGDRWAASGYNAGRPWPHEYGQAFAPRQQMLQRSPGHSQATHMQTASPRAAAAYGSVNSSAAAGDNRTTPDV